MTEEPEGHTLKICPLETECVTVKYLEQCLVHSGYDYDYGILN